LAKKKKKTYLSHCRQQVPPNFGQPAIWPPGVTIQKS